MVFGQEYSRTSIIRPSIIRNLDYPALDYPEPRISGLAVFFLIRLHNSENGRVPQMRMRVAAVTMETCLLLEPRCLDNRGSTV